uniref:hypothetical protein n=2 Tax=Marinilabilia salmonicolor TaxID=989 RepID=UPI00029A2674
MKRFLLSFVFLLTILFAFSGPEAYAQGREGGKELNFNPPVLKGIHSLIDEVEPNYCSQGGSDEIYVNAGSVPSNASYIEWNVLTNVGSTAEHPTWIEEIVVTGDVNGIMFFPDRVDSEYYGSVIRFTYTIYDTNDGPIAVGYDDTYVWKSPDKFSFDDGAGNSVVEICEGESADLVLGNSESTYQYYLHTTIGGTTTISDFPVGGTGNPLVFTVTQEAEYAIEARRGGSPTCSVMMDDVVNVIVNPNPTPNPDYRPASGTSGDPICQGLPFELFDSAPETSGYVYNWTGPGLSGTVTGHTITVSDPAVLTVPGNYEYTLEIEDTNNPTNCTASATVTVTIDDNPTAAPSLNPTAVCEGSPVDINANASGGATPYSYTWSTADNPSFSTVDQPTITIASTSLDDDGDVYTVVVTDALGCQSAAADAPVLVVNDVPEVTISGPTEVCEGNPANYTANVTGSGTYNYQWQLDGTDIAGATSSTLSYDATSLPSIGNHTISVLVTDVANTTNCSATASTSLDVYDTPEVSIDEGDQEVCESTAVTFTSNVTGSGTYTYEWSLGGTVLPGETGSVLNIDAASLPTAGNYTVTVTVTDTDSPLNCNESASVQLTVNDVPEVTISGSIEVCEGNPANYTANVTGSGTYNYQWQLDGTDIAGATSSTLSYDATSLPSIGNHIISVLVTDVANTTNCSATASTS